MCEEYKTEREVRRSNASEREATRMCRETGRFFNTDFD